MNIQTNQTITTTVSEAHQTALPSLIRKRLSIKPGDRLLWKIDEESGWMMVRHAPKDWISYLKGSAKGLYGDPDKYINNLRDEWEEREKNWRKND